MTDQQAGGESRARCDAPHAKAKGPHAPDSFDKMIADLIEFDRSGGFRRWWNGFAANRPAPLLKPGTKVRYRIPPKEDGRGDEGPFVITGVITERGLHGTSVRYRIGNGDIDGDGWELAPELVEPVPEVPVVSEAELLEAIKNSGPVEIVPEPRTARLVEFNQIAANLMESECGRFRATYSGERWSAFDVWTGETSPASMERGPALEWVARRASAPVPPLNWTDFPGGARVHHMGTTFEVFTVPGGKFKAFDPRFTAEAFRSPLFTDLGKAKEWCAVRAMCELADRKGEPGPARPWLTV